MVSNKKSYAMKVLQLALALSLLHGDPDNYLQQQLRSWDIQLELPNGDGWELEMLRAVPMVEYPYANRKAMMPLIEDLVRFDREYGGHNQQNVTAYLLNVHNDTTNQTAAIQDLQAPAPASTGNAAGATAVELPTSVVTTVSTNGSNLGIIPPDFEFLFNADSLQDHRSVLEQNLADLNDFGDLTVQNPYGGLPFKEEPAENNFFDVHFDAFLPVLFGTNSSPPPVEEGAVALNDTFPNPGDATNVKVEPVDDNVDDFRFMDNIATCSTSTAAATIACVKKEESADNDSHSEVDLSPFMSQVELTKEESEIVEVLWKQDVDLGYSLTPAQLLATNETELLGGESIFDDDIEKLKALEELKLDKSKYNDKDDDINENDISDEWAGIPFTIDNETGEYIRLPLDELLNDVIQLAELGAENNEADDDSIASTSKAAAAAAASKTKSESENADEDKDQEKNTNGSKEGAEGELSNDDDLPQSEIEVCSLPSPLFDLDLDDEAKEELADLSIMLQSAAAPFHHHHHHHPHRPTAAGVQNYAAVGGGTNSAFHRQATGFHHGHHQGRMPLSRGVSMEQRLQDIASLFNPIPSMGVSEMPPYPHYPTHHYSYQSAAGIPAPPQHAQYPPPPPPHHHAMLHPNGTLGDICSTQPHYGHNLGSAVTSSMHLTNASHEADGGASNVGAYKMEHEMMYYSNASSDMNHTTDGFINSILNDEDLHLMDMNVNDSFCRLVDANNSTSNNSSVLGISSGHASGGSNSGAGSSTHVLAMGGAAAGAAGGMTADLMSSGATGGDRLDASSDSAVSSMGSERVPSLSDGEWGEGSDSAQDYHQGKYGGPYDYSYNNSTTRLNGGARQPPVAQKKHQMFGKRFLHEQPNMGAAGPVTGNGVAGGGTNGVLQGPAQSIKYEYEPYPSAVGLQHGGSVLDEGAMGPVLSKGHQAYDLKYGHGPMGGYSLDFSIRTPQTPNEIIRHNHTYTLPQGSGSLPRPQQRDKKLSSSSSKSGKSSSEDEHLTRDEKRARSLNIPIAVSDIINLPMDEFNERLSKYDLTENQLSLIRDIRRRGKNKVAAQNCRKRKLDQIVSLEDEVKEVRRRKDHLNQERDSLAVERKRISNKFAALHRHIFQYLRDPEGNPCSPSEYSLQQAADGSIYLLPRDSNHKPDGNSANAAGANNSNGNNNSNNNGNNGSGATHMSHPPAPHQQHAHIAASHTHPHQQPPQHVLAQTHAHHSAQHHHQTRKD